MNLEEIRTFELILVFFSAIIGFFLGVFCLNAKPKLALFFAIFLFLIPGLLSIPIKEYLKKNGFNRWRI